MYHSGDLRWPSNWHASLVGSNPRLSRNRLYCLCGIFLLLFIPCTSRQKRDWAKTAQHAYGYKSVFCQQRHEHCWDVMGWGLGSLACGGHNRTNLIANITKRQTPQHNVHCSDTAMTIAIHPQRSSVTSVHSQAVLVCDTIPPRSSFVRIAYTSTSSFIPMVWCTVFMAVHHITWPRHYICHPMQNLAITWSFSESYSMMSLHAPLWQFFMFIIIVTLSSSS